MLGRQMFSVSTLNFKLITLKLNIISLFSNEMLDTAHL